MNVLIIEPNAALAASVAAAVTRLGHDARVARSSANALAELDSPRVDVLILDRLLPEPATSALRRAFGGQSGEGQPLVIGVINEDGNVPDDLPGPADDYLFAPVTDADLWARLQTAARTIELHRELAGQEAVLHLMIDDLTAQSRHDPLTGIGNRLRMEEDIRALHARTVRYGGSYCVAICDIDDFRAYNDACGRMAGDEVLRAVANQLAGRARGSDSVYRYQGAELVIILSDQTSTGAIRALQRLRRSVEQLGMDHPGATPRSVVTISAGVAVFDSEDTKDPVEVDGLVERAKVALATAKLRGSGSVVAWKPEQPAPKREAL